MAMTGGTDRERQFIKAVNAYYNTPEGPGNGRGWTVLPWAGGTARSRGRV